MLSAIVLGALTSTPAESNAGYEIFAKTRIYWEAQRYPAKLEYDVAVTVVENGKPKIERYRSGYDAVNGIVRSDPVSDYERAYPYHPPGGFSFNVPFLTKPVGSSNVDYFGVPMLAPNYSFGIGITPRGSSQSPSDADIVAAVRKQFHDPIPRNRATPTPQITPGLREIAIVEAKSRAYSISLAGIEFVNDLPAYHLQLRPLRDPERFRLRELWVNARTFAPLRLIEALNFVTGPGTTVPWSVSFSQIGGATYVASETALGATQNGHHHYDAVTVAFENVRPVGTFGYDLPAFAPTDTLTLTEP